MGGFTAGTRPYREGIMTILNAGPPLSSTIMHDFRKGPGGPSGEPPWFICDRDITTTLGRGDETVMLAVPARSPALQSKATVMNRRSSECAVPTCPLCSRRLSGHEEGWKCTLSFHKSLFCGPHKHRVCSSDELKHKRNKATHTSKLSYFVHLCPAAITKCTDTNISGHKLQLADISYLQHGPLSGPNRFLSIF